MINEAASAIRKLAVEDTNPVNALKALRVIKPAGIAAARHTHIGIHRSTRVRSWSTSAIDAARIDRSTTTMITAILSDLYFIINSHTLPQLTFAGECDHFRTGNQVDFYSSVGFTALTGII